MKKNLLIITLLMLTSIILCSCGRGRSCASEIDNKNYYPPDITRIGDGKGCGFGYLIDNNTGVVYLEYCAGQNYGLTVMFNHDGSVMTEKDIKRR